MHLCYHGNGRYFDFFQSAKAATQYGGYFYKVSWSLMKGIQNVFKSPLFCFHGNCGKVCPTDSDFFGLSHSTRCGCCSYQVSSISVRSYDASWSLMKEIKNFLKFPLFYFPWLLISCWTDCLCNLGSKYNGRICPCFINSKSGKQSQSFWLSLIGGIRRIPLKNIAYNLVIATSYQI